MRKNKTKKTVAKKAVKKTIAKKRHTKKIKVFFVAEVFDRYVERAGSVDKFCKKMKIKYTTLWLWKSGRYPVPVVQSLRLQKVFPGVATLEEIYKDFM